MENSFIDEVDFDKELSLMELIMQLTPVLSLNPKKELR